MSNIKIFYSIGKADFLNKTRKFRFLVLLVIMGIIVSYFVPEKNANLGAMDFGGYRGIYDSIWIGNTIAFTSSIFISLFGFYIVKNNISNDKMLRIDEFIYSSQLKPKAYIKGKLFGNFIILSCMSFVLMISGMVTQLVRGDVKFISVIDYIIPYIMFVLPTVFFISSVAILFDCIPDLKGSIGNIVYFSIFILMLSITVLTDSIFDLYGRKILFSHIMNTIQLIDPTYKDGVTIFGSISYKGNFMLSQINWTFDKMFSRLVVIIVAYVIMIISIQIYKVTYKKEERVEENAYKNSAFTKINHIEPVPNIFVDKEYSLSFNQPQSIKFDFLYFFILEIKSKIKREKLSYIITVIITLFISYLFPLSITWDHILAWLWILILPFISNLNLIDFHYRSEELLEYNIYAPYKILVSYLSGVFILLVLSSGTFIKLIVCGNWNAILFLSTSAFFIPSLSLLLGKITKTSKFFEILYIVWWYTGAFLNTAVLDFTGFSTSDQMLSILSLDYVILTIISLSFIYYTKKS